MDMKPTQEKTAQVMSFSSLQCNSKCNFIGTSRDNVEHY